MNMLSIFAACLPLPSCPCCHVCGRLLSGSFLVDAQNRRMCLSHRDDPSCDGCGIPVMGAATGPGATPALCRSCQPSAITDPKPAAKILPEVHADLRRLGLPWWPQNFPVRLVGKAELLQAGPVGARSDTVGQAKAIWSTLDGRITERKVTEILILRGLGPLRFRAILAHELGHAWLWQMGFMNLPSLYEEGFAELCAHRWLGLRSEPFAAILRRRMEQNDDPVYGDGFREMSRSFSQEADLSNARAILQKLVEREPIPSCISRS